MTTFVDMYHPLIPATSASPVHVPPQAVDDYEARGWLELNPASPPPVIAPYLTQEAGDSRYLPLWRGATPVLAGQVFMAPDGQQIQRIADGTTRATYDVTEQALWSLPLRAAYGLAIAATVTASGALVVGKHNPVDATAAARTMTLPTGQAEGATLIVEKVDSSANAVAVTGSVRGVGSSTINLVWTHETLVLRADSTGSWWPVAGHKTKASLDGAYARVVDITSLGAVAGQDSTTAIAAAIDAATAGGAPGRVVIPAGNFLFSSISKTVSNLTIEGMPGSTLTCTKPINGTAMDIQLTGSNITVRGLTIRYQTPLNVDTDGGNVINGAHTLRIGGSTTGGTTTWGDGILVENCDFDSGRQNTIDIYQGRDVRIRANKIRNGGATGIFIGDCQRDVWVTDNDVQKTGDDSIAVVSNATGAVGTGTQGATVRDNKIRDSYGKGVAIAGVDGGSVRGNYINNTWAPGILVQYDLTFTLGPTNRVDVEGNNVINPGKNFGTGHFKTAAHATPDGIAVAQASYVAIARNKIFASQRRGISASTSDATNYPVIGLAVTDNEIIGALSVGIQLGTTGTTTYDDIRDFVIARNRIQGVVSGLFMGRCRNGKVSSNAFRSFDSGSASQTRGIFISGVTETVLESNTFINDDSADFIVRNDPSATNVRVQETGSTTIIPGVSIAGASGNSDVQTFTAGGTWTKPVGSYTRARISFTAPGGGGGSGRKGASGSVCCGGGGGAHGTQGSYEFALADLPATLTIGLGTAGAGGTAVSANDTNGNAGATGGSVTITGTGFSLQAVGGGGGSGGTATTGTGATGATTSQFAASGGVSASTTGGVPSGASRSGNAAGAAGGGIPTGATFSAGGAGISAPQTGGSSVAAAGGATDGAAGGAADTTAISLSMMPPAGRSGGGGASSVTGAGGAGGAGFGYGYGGSGGGASLDTGGASGAGSAGGPGLVVIVSY